VAAAAAVAAENATKPSPNLIDNACAGLVPAHAFLCLGST